MYCEGKYFISRYLFKLIKKGIGNIARAHINKTRNEEAGWNRFCKSGRYSEFEQ